MYGLIRTFALLYAIDRTYFPTYVRITPYMATTVTHADDAFGSRLDTAIENSEISGRRLAEELGVDKSTVSSWRTGKNKPRHGHLVRVAKILSISIDELVEDRGSAEAEKLVERLASLESSTQAVTDDLLQLMADARAYREIGRPEE